MNRLPFLQVVAEQYARKYSSDPSRLCFVFPNKRSGTFFLKFFRYALPKGVHLAPRVTTLSALAEELSGRVVDSRIDLIMRVYSIYRDMQPEGVDLEGLSFARLASWAETVLKDFDECDMHEVDVEALFANAEDYKRISANFLTPGQKEVGRYFGYEDSDYDNTRFWNHIAYRSASGSGRSTKIRERFLKIWELLHPIYLRLNKELDADGLTYQGAAYRRASEILAETEAAPLRRDFDRIVFVGFGMLSTSERNIFKACRDAVAPDGNPFGEFVWNYTGPAMEIPFMERNIQDFPKPDWLSLSQSDSFTLPELSVISSPSNVAQAKIAGEIIREIKNQAPDDKEIFRHAKVAVVLPDKDLLLPLVYSIPEEIEDVNLTMGYAMKYTPASSFVSLLIRLQRNKKTSAGRTLWFHQDIRLLLAHPFVRAMFARESVTALLSFIAQSRSFSIDARELTGRLADGCEKERLSMILTPLTPQTPHPEAARHIVALLRLAKEAVKNTDSGNARFDLSHLDKFIDSMLIVCETLKNNDIATDYLYMLRLAVRLVSGETVAFEGQPLEGLQVMGVLESRALDFDYVIIPSMNEKVFPRIRPRKSFIPVSLRAPYLLPRLDAEENEAAYNFYSLIARAKKAWFIYDGRSGGLKSGDPSRYILQLQHLHARGKVRMEHRSFSRVAPDPQTIAIRKSPEDLRLLERFKSTEDPASLSATSLEAYIQCPLRFYFKKIARIPETLSPIDTLDAITEGLIIHGVMENIYLDDPELHNRFLDKPILVTPERIQEIMADGAGLRARIVRGINTEFLKNTENPDAPLRPDLEMIVDPLVEQIQRILARDLTHAPLSILGVEFGAKYTEPQQYPLSDGSKVNFSYSIDRMDRTREGVTRILDYKTGKAYLSIPDIPSLFEEDTHCKYAFQLLLYADLFDRAHPGTPLQPEIYSTPAMAKNDSSSSASKKNSGPSLIQIDGEPLLSHTQLLPSPADPDLTDPSPADPDFEDPNISGFSESPTPSEFSEDDEDAEFSEADVDAEFSEDDEDAKSPEPVIEAFRKNLDVLLQKLFDPEIPFTQCATTKNCRFCQFTSFCRRT